MSDLLEHLTAALADRYRVDREIGRGGMAYVFLARDLKLDRPVALKVLRPDLAAALGGERFLREIEIAAKLTHPNILGLHDCGEAGGQLYYTMPYVEGESLRDRLNREKQLPIPDALQITKEVADALGYAHSLGIVHRDIKPENILFTAGHPIVSDFGIARAVTAAGVETLTETGLAVGTPGYMSPEQASGSKDIDARSDLYSLGCVLYEMLSGEPPHIGNTPQAILAKKLTEPAPRVSVLRDKVPPAVEAALDRVLSRTPADRFATAERFTVALEAKGAPPRPKKMPARIERRMRVGFVALVLLILGVGGGAVIYLTRAGDVIAPQETTIAVAPFVPTGTDTALARLGRDLVVTLSTSLDGVGRIRVVDAMAVLSQAQGHRVLYDREAAAAMARRLGAGSVVHGTLVQVGPDVRLDFGVFTSDSLDELVRGSLTAPGTDIVALTDSASWSIVRGLSRTAAVPSLQGLTTASLPALRAYLNGEQATAEGRWNDALAAYRESAREDSTFWEVYFANGRASMFASHDEGDPLMSFRELMGHFDEMPASLQECWKADWPWNPWRDPGEPDPPKTGSYYLAHYASAVELHPDCPGVWWEYADKMVHFGSRVGYSKADRQAAVEAAIRRYPQVSWFWDHLLWITLGRDSIAVGRALEALTRLEPHPGNIRVIDRLLDRAYRTGAIDTALADSAALGMKAADDFPSVWAIIEYGFPREAIDLASRILSLGVPRQAADFLRRDMAVAWAARGAWDSALVVQDRLVGRGVDGAELDAYRMAAVGAWLGALPLSTARKRRAAVVATLEEAAGIDSAEVWWLDGLIAVTEQDEQGLMTALSALRQMDDTTKRATEASLRALQLGLVGNTADASRVLAEREWRDTDQSFGNLDYEGHPYVRPVNRLALARWLLASGDTAQARRMLFWYEVHGEGWRSLAAATFVPIAYLMLGQIEEAREHEEVARAHYEQVLQRYDMPVPALRRVVTEAEAGIGRIALRR